MLSRKNALRINRSDHLMVTYVRLTLKDKCPACLAQCSFTSLVI